MIGLRYAKMAEVHWKKWTPTRYKSLVKAGTLEQETQAAGRRAAEQVASLMEAGANEHEAEEMVLRDEIICQPESGADGT